MKTKFIYVVLMALFLGSQMTLSAQNKDCLLYTSPSPRDS